MAKLWSGRFECDTDRLADEFNTSLPVDKRMYRQDIQASIAHAKMLGDCKILSQEDELAIVEGLNTILSDIDSGELVIENEEDIHMFVEKELTLRIGDAGKRLHTARSRNDQVVTDFKLYITDSIYRVKAAISSFIDRLLAISEQNLYTYMPGFTHMQKAQPITLAHHLTAYAEMFYRDLERFTDSYKRVSLCPLGSSALAGTTYPIDRKDVLKYLKAFSDITNNSLDSVSDRDYVAEYLFDSSLVITHLSRLSEEVITWASNEYRFIELSDAFSTGSSIMPQKKNPDMAELVRGKSGRIFGNLIAILTILKGLPLAYNKDLQEDKSLLFETEDTIVACLNIFEKMLETASFNSKNMFLSAQKGYTNATDAADYLVKKGVPFRDAHEIIGRLVKYSINLEKPLEEIPLPKLKEFSPLFEKDIYDEISIKTLIERRISDGGTSPKSVKKSIKNLRLRLKKLGY